MLVKIVSMFFAGVSLILIMGSQVFAQNSAQSSQMSGAAQYFLGERDQILMNINVWGYVRNPGQYLVPRNTDLISLISFAGGPREGANLSKVTIVRGGRVEANERYAKNGHNGKTPVISVDVKRNLERGEILQIPLLQAGDTVIIPESGGSKFQKFLGINSIWSVIAATATVAIIIERLNN